MFALLLCFCLKTSRTVIWEMFQHRSAIVTNKTFIFWPKVRPLEYIASDKTAVSSRSWLERNTMSCADKMRYGNASPLGTERSRVSLKSTKAQVSPELWQDPSVLLVETALMTRVLQPASGELLSHPHPRAQGASPAATPGPSFSRGQGGSSQTRGSSSPLGGSASARVDLSITLPPHLTGRQECCSPGTSRNWVANPARKVRHQQPVVQAKLSSSTTAFTYTSRSMNALCSLFCSNRKSFK